ncbi:MULTISPECIES: hypothetical protein [Clostridia]|uniref:hypothetical protein n=1 Tax=Clostridia TaxID=186801 RepID=UPI002A8E2D0C|nr:hypothetical protein [Peptostreptococcus porci]MDY5098760.1 hypothetical protein [Clostridium sp.]MDY5437425.1 hypothetical protein [Peptostreptococcus porci]
MKNTILNKVNSSLYEQERMLGTMYRGKTFAVVSPCGQIKCAKKTKRGAEGYISKYENFSYYDEYTMELVYPGANDSIIEIKESELIGFNSWELWYNELKGYLGHPYLISNLKQWKKFVTDKDLLTYIDEAMEDIKNDRGLLFPAQLQEKEEPQEEEAQEIKEEKKNNTATADIEKIVLNEEKNGIEIYFVGKPAEEVRNSLKAQGFRWSKYNKCWYAKQSQDTIEFANSLKNIDIEELEKNSEEYKAEKEKELKIKLAEINIDDIESYTVDEKISKRENENGFFRSKDIDHEKVIQERLLQANNEVVRALKNNSDLSIEYNLKMALQRFKKNYHENYVAMITHKANNPSWAVTGRSGLNVNKYNKAQDRYTKLMLKSNELIENFNKQINRAKDQIRKNKNIQIEKEIESASSKVSNYDFKRVKKDYNINATDNIFNAPNSNKSMLTVNEEYFIFKNWGAYRVYDVNGKQLYYAKSKGTLEDAKKWLVYYLENKVA